MFSVENIVRLTGGALTKSPASPAPSVLLVFTRPGETTRNTIKIHFEVVPMDVFEYAQSMLHDKVPLLIKEPSPVLEFSTFSLSEVIVDPRVVTHFDNLLNSTECYFLYRTLLLAERRDHTALVSKYKDELIAARKAMLPAVCTPIMTVYSATQNITRPPNATDPPMEQLVATPSRKRTWGPESREASRKRLERLPVLRDVCFKADMTAIERARSEEPSRLSQTLSSVATEAVRSLSASNSPVSSPVRVPQSTVAQSDTEPDDDRAMGDHAMHATAQVLLALKYDRE